VLNVPPPRGESFEPLDEEHLTGKQILAVVHMQRILRGMKARKRTKALTDMSPELRTATLKFEHQMTNEETFRKHINNKGQRRDTMEQIEFIHLLRSINMLRVSHTERCKVSKTQAMQLFLKVLQERSVAEKEKLTAREQVEISYPEYQVLLRRCLNMIEQTERRELEFAKEMGGDDNEGKAGTEQGDFQRAASSERRHAGPQGTLGVKISKPEDAMRALVGRNSVLNILYKGDNT